jgi:hypothetical protein
MYFSVLLIPARILCGFRIRAPTIFREFSALIALNGQCFARFGVQWPDFFP